MTKPTKRKNAPHDKFVGCVPVTNTLDIISTNNRPLVLGTVIKDSDEELKLQLDYLGDKVLKDSTGYIGVRWTKQDLLHMLSLVELTEERLNNERRQQQESEAISPESE